MNALHTHLFCFLSATQGVLWCQSHSRNNKKIPYEKLLWRNYFPATQRKTAKQNWVERTQREWKKLSACDVTNLAPCVIVYASCKTCNSRIDGNENKKCFRKKESKENWMASIADLRLHISRREGENAAKRWCPSQRASAVTSGVHPGIITISQMRQGCECERLKETRTSHVRSWSAFEARRKQNSRAWKTVQTNRMRNNKNHANSCELH